MTTWRRFPTDDISLRLLVAACEINPDSGRTHLEDFLHMGTRVARIEAGGVQYETVDEALADDLGDGPPVVFLEYEKGHEPHSPHTVIISLVEEIQRLRGDTP